MQGGADAWQGPHKSTRMPLRGATWREGGWCVKGATPWGSNTIALNCPAIYTHLFLRVGLCSRVDLKCKTRGVVRGVGCNCKEGDSLIA